MKLNYTLLSLLSILFFATSTLFAVKPIKNAPVESAAKTELTDKQAKKLKKFEKRIQKRMDKLEANNSSDVDFDDPVDKWMWFWIFGWGLGVAALLLGEVLLAGLFGTIAAAFFVFGFVALVLWLVKKFG